MVDVVDMNKPVDRLTLSAAVRSPARVDRDTSCAVPCAAPRVVFQAPKRHPRPQRFSLRGFTLIEALIVVALVAILAAVALPSYRDYIKKSARAEAQAYLMAVAARQQQFLLDTRSYSTLSVDAVVAQPRNVAAAYAVSMVTVSGPPPSFTLTATPTSNQASDKCGTLTLNETGTTTAAVAGCW